MVMKLDFEGGNEIVGSKMDGLNGNERHILPTN